jgi:hypothetical protein
MKRGLVCALTVLLLSSGAVLAEEPLAAMPPVGDHVAPVAGPIDGAIVDPHPIHVDAEYLLWRINSSAIAVGVAGREGDQQGGRFMLSYMAIPDDFCSVEAGAFFLGRNDNFTTTVGGLGNFSNTYWGAELNADKLLCQFGSLTINGFVGFRYFSFNEETDTTFRNGVGYTTVDNLITHNDFYGVHLGMDACLQFQHFFIDTRGSIALGANKEVADVYSVNSPLPGLIVPGGAIFAPVDNGRHARTKFCAQGDVIVRVGYWFTDNICGSIGFDGTYMKNIARAGNQFNASFAGSGFVFTDSNVTIEGLNFGIEVRF